MNSKTIERIDLDNVKHCQSLIQLLSDYMEDEMGCKQPMPKELAPKILRGLKLHSSYLGFLVKMNDEYVALANCNLNYSTWKALSIINIHDFIVHTNYRKMGYGKYLLNGIREFAKNNDCCKITLEVREDNSKAKKLYNNVGFSSGSPAMLFWEMKL